MVFKFVLLLQMVQLKKYFFEGVATQSIESHIPIDLKNKCSSINYEFKNVMFHPITDEPIVCIADIPYLIKNIVKALEMSSLNKIKNKYETLWMST